MAKTTSKELYVPCKDGGCNMSAKFKSGGFKCDLKKLLRKLSDKPRSALQAKLDIWENPDSGIYERRCPDAISRYTLGNIGEDKVDSMSLETIEKKGIEVIHDLQSIPKVKNIPKIIVVLESPHVDEYEVKPCKKDEGRNCPCRDYVRPAPARGLTGRNIKHYLSRIFDCDEFKTYKIALINPIQYQCSLGDLKSGLKDEIFARLIKMPHYKKCFRERFAHVYNPGKDIVVNCCTDKRKNKDIVNECLKSVMYCKAADERRFCLLEMNHPCVWHFNCAVRRVYCCYGGVRPKNRADYFCQKDSRAKFQKAIRESLEGEK